MSIDKDQQTFYENFKRARAKKSNLQCLIPFSDVFDIICGWLFPDAFLGMRIDFKEKNRRY